ncbi:hypothetical protein Moror_13463, partial [Moniliophthora roreri MCA 2997]
KSVCGHLNALNKQNRSKFKNTNISGIVNCQCDHIFVLASGNLPLGERFVAVDRVLTRALSLQPFNVAHVPVYIVSYDSMCSFCVKIPGHWAASHPKHAHLIPYMQFVIPVCHCCNHIDSCKPLYLYTYKEGAGWFSAEMAEMYWPILNAVGAACRQMNLSPQEEHINMSHGDWNWRKTLFKDLKECKKIYIEKRDHFVALCQVFANKVVIWNEMDHSPVVVDKWTVKSVYSHGNVKAPTLEALFNKMQRTRETVLMPTGKRRMGAAASYIQAGLDIYLEQKFLLVQDMKKFRQKQVQFLPAEFDVARLEDLSPELEAQKLYLPSEFSAPERSTMKLSSLTTKEANLIRQRLVKLVWRLHMVVQIYSEALLCKRNDEHGQEQNMRANQHLTSIRNECDLLIQHYESL